VWIPEIDVQWPGISTCQPYDAIGQTTATEIDDAYYHAHLREIKKSLTVDVEYVCLGRGALKVCWRNYVLLCFNCEAKK
jgi:hypothetical protein